jgi:hypothetical protein
MDLEDAQHALLKAMRDTTNLETGGSRSRLEDLTGRQLAERVNEAKRALRLGQGNQTDLLISLAQAENALADFEAQVDSGSPVAKAQLGVMAAAEGAAIAEAELRMEGEAAIAAFKNMAEAVGLADSALGLLTKVDEEDMNVFEKIFSQEVIDAIDLVGQGIGLINEELDEAAQRDAAIDAAIIPPGQQALRPDFERSDGTWPSHFDDPSATSSRFGAKNRMFNGGSWQQMSSLGMGGPTSGLGSDGSAYAGMAAPDWTGTIDHLGGGGAAPFGGGYGNIGSVSVNAINVTVSSVSDIGSGAMTGVMDSVMDAEVSGSKLAPRPN